MTELQYRDMTAALGMIKKARQKFPDMRICQLIVNATTADPFYVEDRDLALALVQLLDNLGAGT